MERVQVPRRVTAATVFVKADTAAAVAATATCSIRDCQATASTVSQLCLAGMVTGKGVSRRIGGRCMT